MNRREGVLFRLRKKFNQTAPVVLRLVYLACAVGLISTSGITGGYYKNIFLTFCFVLGITVVFQLLMCGISDAASPEFFTDFDRSIINNNIFGVKKHVLIDAVRLMHGGEFNDALEILNELNDKDSDEHEKGVIGFYMSICYNRMGYPTNAARSAKEAADAGIGGAESMLMAARSFQIAGNYAEAEECYSSLLPEAERQRIYPFIYNEMGKLYLSLKEPEKSRQSFQTAMRLGLDPATAQWGMALALLMDGREDEACEWYRLALISRIGDFDEYKKYCGQVCLSMGYPENYLDTHLREKYHRQV